MTDKLKDDIPVWTYRAVILVLFGFSSTMGWKAYDKIDHTYDAVIRNQEWRDGHQREFDKLESRFEQHLRDQRRMDQTESTIEEARAQMGRASLFNNH